MKKENKLLAILSYLGILFLVPYIYNKNSDFVKHHAKTGRNLFLIKTAIFLLTYIIIGDVSAQTIPDYLNSLTLGNIIFICALIIIFGVYEIIGMINVLRGNQKNLPLLKNMDEITKCTIVITSMFIVPDTLMIFIYFIIKNHTVSALLANGLFIFFLYIIYKKDLIKEFKIFKSDYKESIKLGLKYYFIGLGIMALSNLFINMTVGEISQNESLVRETMFKLPLYSFLSISIFAPITEELVFRKSLRNIFKNKWFYALTCGVLFGLGHIITLDFSLIDLIYVIPYGSLGFAFALAYYDKKNIYTPMLIHSLHNTITFFMLIFANSVGAL